jgi:hypothetical protein
MVKYKPRKIYGCWAEGYVLDIHSTGSTLLGHNEFGHPQFETHRTEIGELLFRLKCRSDANAVKELVDAAEPFIRQWGIGITVGMSCMLLHSLRPGAAHEKSIHRGLPSH